jgi:rifampin ADP-ribosylating transferase
MATSAGADRSEDSSTNQRHAEEEIAVATEDTDYVPVTFDRCDHLDGPFYHGTRFALEVGDQLVPGQGSNYHEGRVSNNIYFSAIIETAVWGAELATALAGSDERGHVYVVEPTGPFEDDPNVTNKRFPGNITQSYRTRHPLQIMDEVQGWEGHPPEVLNRMLENIARLREQDLDVIED